MPTYKLTPTAARTMWTTALRSGDYQQTRGLLCRIGENGSRSYCCLGLACELMRQIEGNEAMPITVLGQHALFGHTSSATLPLAAMEWLGLQSQTGNYDDGALTALNDTFIMSFDGIADVIDSEPKGLVSTVERVA